MSIVFAAKVCFFAPLLGCLMAAVCQYTRQDRLAHGISILSVALAFFASLVLGYYFIYLGHDPLEFTLYSWLRLQTLHIQFGFLLDALSCSMLMVVTLISLCVHVYSIGYMHEEIGYARFFAWMSLFTFMMINLVIAIDVVQLFFGWEGVGLVSYWLIGFYYKKLSAAEGGMKAFLLNRVGDMGFLLGITACYYLFDTTHISNVIASVPNMVGDSIFGVHGLSFIALSWFVGAMGKSAQMPLHLWLPESMEGPTPISALIHAATMVTAGIYMMCRFAPVYEHSLWVSNVIVLVGCSGALWLGLVGLVQMDIKRVVAFSTLSQLGYMVAAVGAGAYSAAMFHLITHAFFKALLFLAAGSVIHALHHEQSLAKMGYLQERLPLSGLLFLFAALSLSAIPPFSGYFSKDVIIEAVMFQSSKLLYGDYASLCLLLGAVVTPLYIFRVFWLCFYTDDRTELDDDHVQEAPFSMLFPMIILGFFSVVLGYSMSVRLANGLLFHNSIPIATTYATSVTKLVHYELSKPLVMMEHSLGKLPLYCSLMGLLISWFWYCYLSTSQRFRFYARVEGLAWILSKQYGLSYLLEGIIVPTLLKVANGMYRFGDVMLLNTTVDKGIATNVIKGSGAARQVQTGYLQHYLVYIIGGLLITIVYSFLTRGIV